MPAQTILFVGDKLHYSQTGPSVYSVTSTAAGYNQESVRDTSWLGAWKPNNSAIDEAMIIDMGSTGYLGTGSETIYVAFAYDARAALQTTIKIQNDAADNPAGAFATNKATIVPITSALGIAYASFTLEATEKRYYRIIQPVADRTGTTTVPIYAIAFFTPAQTYNIDTGYIADAPGPGDFIMGSNVGVGESAGGIWHTNKNGPPYQEFDVTFNQATASLWTALKANWNNWHSGPGRAIWLQYEGIDNAAQDSFGIVHLLSMQSNRSYLDQYDTRLRFRTCGKPL